jgi:hypothetical protein
MRTLIVATLLVVGMPAPGAQASTGADQADRPEVWAVAGKEVLRFRVAAGGMTPRQRVEELDTRMTNILSKVERAIGVADVEMELQGPTARITVCGDLLVTVLPDDAGANKTTVEKLGRSWLTNIRKTVPQLSPRVNRGGA